MMNTLLDLSFFLCICFISQQYQINWQGSVLVSEKLVWHNFFQRVKKFPKFIIRIKLSEWGYPRDGLLVLLSVH